MDNASTRWRARDVALAVMLAIAVGTFAFVLRFNALGGALAGFDDEEFNKLTRADLILAGEQPLRDFTDGELRGVWPSLTYEIPAMAQRVFGRSLLTHGVLTCGVMALCAMIVLVLARDLSRSWIVAAIAAIAVVASTPKLYNYPKVLSLTIAAAVIWWVLRKPTAARLAGAAAATVAAALFRHDYGVYVAVGTIAGLIAYEWRPWHVPLRRIAVYAGWGLLMAVPSTLWVAYYAGIPQYVHDALTAVGAEGRRLASWPVINARTPLEMDSLIAFTYYAFWGITIAAVLRLIAGARQRGGAAASPHVPIGVALVAIGLIANYFFLRSNLPARFGDAMVPVALVAAWLSSPVPARSPRLSRTTAHLTVAGLLAFMCFAFYRMNELNRELATTRLDDSVAAARRRFIEVAEGLRAEPPATWTDKPVERSIAVSRYLAECTAPEDRVLLATFADEIAYFARRRFAGGQRRFTSNVLTTEADQRNVLRRLSQQSVPVVVTDMNYEHEFVADYPLVARHIESHYRDVGVIRTDGRPILHVWVDKTRHAVRTDPVLGFPCFQ